MIKLKIKISIILDQIVSVVFDFDNSLLLHDVKYYGERLKFIFFSLTRHEYNLHPVVKNALFIADGNVYLKEYWHEWLCELGGCDKQDFLKFERAIFELRELYDKGEFEIHVIGLDGQVPNLKKYKKITGNIDDRIKRSKKMIGKNAGKPKRRGCPIDIRKLEAGYIRPCCVCKWEPLKLTKNKKNT